MTQDPKMSAQAIITLIKGLGEVDRQAVFAAFAIDAPAASPATAPKKAKVAKEAKEPKAEKKPRANAGIGTAWSAFSTKLQLEHKAELDAVKAEAATKRACAKAAGLPVPEDTKGAHLHWCSAYKLANKAEWEAFKADWEAKHPKGGNAASSSDDAVTVVDDDGDNAVSNAVSGAVGGSGSAPAPAATSTDAAAKAKRGPKKMADMTPEELAAAKAKRAAKKAAKASADNSAEGSRASSPPKIKDE